MAARRGASAGELRVELPAEGCEVAAGGRRPLGRPLHLLLLARHPAVEQERRGYSLCHLPQRREAGNGRAAEGVAGRRRKRRGWLRQGEPRGREREGERRRRQEAEEARLAAAGRAERQGAGGREAAPPAGSGSGGVSRRGGASSLCAGGGAPRESGRLRGPTACAPDRGAREAREAWVRLCARAWRGGGEGGEGGGRWWRCGAQRGSRAGINAHASARRWYVLFVRKTSSSPRACPRHGHWRGAGQQRRRQRGDGIGPEGSEEAQLPQRAQHRRVAPRDDRAHPPLERLCPRVLAPVGVREESGVGRLSRDGPGYLVGRIEASIFPELELHLRRVIRRTDGAHDLELLRQQRNRAKRRRRRPAGRMNAQEARLRGEAEALR